MIDVYKRSELRIPKGEDIEISQTATPVLSPVTLTATIGVGVAIYGIDPGPESSALVGLDSEGIPSMVDIWPNLKILKYLRDQTWQNFLVEGDLLAIESMASYGMPVGDPVFVSCYWIGRFAEAWGGTVRLIKAPQIRAHLCGSASKAKKSHVRRALLDKYLRTGGGATPEIGTKGKPGPLYGFTSHSWSALAVAVTARETDLGVVLP